MAGTVETYFAKSPYLPVRPSVRNRLLAVLDSAAPAESRRAAFEEAAYAYPLFSFNLLKIVNSAKFNLRTKIVVIKQAVSLPTIDQFAEVIREMPEYPDDMESIFSIARFEEHSRATAATVQLLASLGKRFSTLDRERFMSAAMFHDIGRVFLALSDPDGYARMTSKTDETASRIESEKIYFGTDHATVGAIALESIGVTDADVVDSVRHHHALPSGTGVLVAYADRVTKRFGIGPAAGSDVTSGIETQDEARLRLAIEETVHMTVGEILMHVLSEIDGQLASGMEQLKSVSGPS